MSEKEKNNECVELNESELGKVAGGGPHGVKTYTVRTIFEDVYFDDKNDNNFLFQVGEEVYFLGQEGSKTKFVSKRLIESRTWVYTYVNGRCKFQDYYYLKGIDLATNGKSFPRSRFGER